SQDAPLYEKKKMARFPAPSSNQTSTRLTGVRNDVACRTRLVVDRRRGLRALDAVGVRGGRDDRHVLDAGVNRLELRQGRTFIADAAGVVGVVRLQSRHSSADVGLGSRLVGAQPEAEVGGKGDGE